MLPNLGCLGLCENFLYGFKAARWAARAADSARLAALPLTLPLRRRQTPVGWRERQRVGVAETTGSRPSRGGFDKGTLAAALIGQTRAGEKPAQSAHKRTGRRPLSNPPLRQRGTDPLRRYPHVRRSRYCQGPLTVTAGSDA